MTDVPDDEPPVPPFSVRDLDHTAPNNRVAVKGDPSATEKYAANGEFHETSDLGEARRLAGQRARGVVIDARGRDVTKRLE